MRINLGIQLELLSPLSLPLEERNNFSSSHEYISGSTVRGAMAAQYLREFEKDQLFSELFSGDLIFNDFYPVVDNKESFLLPSTAVACKRQALDHGLKDHLWLFSAQELYFAEKGQLKNLDKIYRCNHQGCTQDLKGQSGFVYLEEKKIKKLKIGKQVHIHTGVNRDTGNIQDGIFFSLEEITQPNIFTGEILIAENLRSEFEKRFADQILFIGKNKTRGNGRVKVTFTESKKPKNNLEERLTNFNQGFQQYLKNQFGLERNNFFYFSLNFVSDAILLDKLLRYSYLAEEMKMARLVFQSISQTTIKGWNMAWQLPKENEIAVKKGSSYLFEIPQTNVAESKKILAEWEMNGLGVRKNEGFGQLIISNDFYHNYAVRG